ncbi:MAG: hypothetical protein RIS36_1443 [Pseudomonadota bacterium]|jgi:hypothetical protein
MIRETPQTDKSKPVEKEQHIEHLVPTTCTVQFEMIGNRHTDPKYLNSIRNQLEDRATELHRADNNSRDSE